MAIAKGGSRQIVHSIQLLRAVAALIVALYHVHLAFSAQTSLSINPGETYFFGIGPLGVHIFFVISGFIMVYVTDGQRFILTKFLSRRLHRIYPIYWICASLFILYHLAIGPAYELTSVEFMGAVLLLPGNAASIIGPAWTLAYEMFFYISFGLAMTFGRDRGLLILFGVFFALILAGVVIEFDSAFWHVVTNPLLLEFLAGTGIGWLYIKGLIKPKLGWLLLLAGLTLFVAGYLFGYARIPTVIVWGVPSALLVLGLVSIEREEAIPRSVKRAATLGDSSYALYLIHILVITVAIDIAGALEMLPNIPPVLAAVVLGVAAMVVGEALHRQIERPLLRKLISRKSLRG